MFTFCPHRRSLPRQCPAVWVCWTLLAGGANACSDQPSVVCTSARVPYAAKYSRVTGTGDCAELTGEELGVYTFNGSNPDGTPNWSDATLSIQPLWIYQQEAGGAGAEAFSRGQFDRPEPDPRGLCTVGHMTSTIVNVAAVPEGSTDANGQSLPSAPAKEVRYEWSNLKVRVTPETVGTAFVADLAYTSGDCGATYAVWAVAPAIRCATSPATTVDPAVCLPADPSQGRFTGSGIDPSFEVACDPGSSLCVPTRDPTSSQ